MYAKVLPALRYALERGYHKGHAESHLIVESPSYEDVMKKIVEQQLYAIREWFYIDDQEYEELKIGGTD